MDLKDKIKKTLKYLPIVAAMGLVTAMPIRAQSAKVNEILHPTKVNPVESLSGGYLTTESVKDDLYLAQDIESGYSTVFKKDTTLSGVPNNIYTQTYSENLSSKTEVLVVEGGDLYLVYPQMNYEVKGTKNIEGICKESDNGDKIITSKEASNLLYKDVLKYSVPFPKIK